jgi:hypothetical protein
VTYVCKIDQRHDEPVKEHEANNNVDLCPPRDNERIANQGDLRPIKGQDAHSEAEVGTKQSIDRLAFWFDPTEPWEGAQKQHEKPYKMLAHTKT